MKKPIKKKRIKNESKDTIVKKPFIAPDLINSVDEFNLGEEITQGELVNTNSNNTNNCTYHLTMHFNNEMFDCFTNDLKIGMLSFKPLQLHTEGYIKIQKGEAIFERKYNLVDLRKIFNDDERLDLFINNLQLG